MGLIKTIKEDLLFEKITTSHFETYKRELEHLYFSRHLGSLPSFVVGIALIFLIKKYHKIDTDVVDEVMVKFKNEYPKDLFSALLGDPIYHYQYVRDSSYYPKYSFVDSSLLWSSKFDLKKVYGSNMVMGHNILRRFGDIIGNQDFFLKLLIKHKEILYRFLEPVSKSDGAERLPNIIHPKLYDFLFSYGSSGQDSASLWQDVEFVNRVLKYFVIINCTDSNYSNSSPGRQIQFRYNFLNSASRFNIRSSEGNNTHHVIGVLPYLTQSSSYQYARVKLYQTITNNPTYFKKVKDELITSSPKNSIENLFNELRMTYAESTYQNNRNVIPRYVAMVRPYGMNNTISPTVYSYGEMGGMRYGSGDEGSASMNITPEHFINENTAFLLMNEFTQFGSSSEFYRSVNNYKYRIIIYEILK